MKPLSHSHTLQAACFQDFSDMLLTQRLILAMKLVYTERSALTSTSVSRKAAACKLRMTCRPSDQVGLISVWT